MAQRTKEDRAAKIARDRAASRRQAEQQYRKARRAEEDSRMNARWRVWKMLEAEMVAA